MRTRWRESEPKPSTQSYNDDSSIYLHRCYPVFRRPLVRLITCGCGTVASRRFLDIQFSLPSCRIIESSVAPDTERRPGSSWWKTLERVGGRCVWVTTVLKYGRGRPGRHYRYETGAALRSAQFCEMIQMPHCEPWRTRCQSPRRRFALICRGLAIP
jgi:hypothetical protein